MMSFDLNTSNCETDLFFKPQDGNMVDSTIKSGQHAQVELLTNNNDTATNNTVTHFVTQQFYLNLQDIGKAIGYFDENTNINRWLENFSDYANLFNWNDNQKFVIGKKLLTGLPKSFIQTEYGIDSWLKLKNALVLEFSPKLNSFELHKLLSNRKMKAEEKFYEYFLAMRELASIGSIEAEALIQYIIDGIPDEVPFKLSLYEVKTMNQLKERLQIYSKLQNKLLLKDKKTNHSSSTEKTLTELKKEDMTSTENALNESIVTVGGKNNAENSADIKNLPNSILEEDVVTARGKNNGKRNSPSVSLSELSIDSMDQLQSIIMPHITVDMKDMKDRLAKTEEKLINVKIDLERLLHEVSRQTINLSSITKRVQLVEVNKERSNVANQKDVNMFNNLQNDKVDKKSETVEKISLDSKEEVPDEDRGKKKFERKKKDKKIKKILKDITVSDSSTTEDDESDEYVSEDSSSSGSE